MDGSGGDYFFSVLPDTVQPFGPVRKKNLDVTLLIFDFTCWLNSGETISTISMPSVHVEAAAPVPPWQNDYPLDNTSAYPPSDTYTLTIQSSTIASSSTQIQILVAAGTPGLSYVVSAVATSSATQSRHKQIDCIVTIEMPLNFELLSGSPGGPTSIVREIDTAAPLTGGPITSSGTIGLATPLAINYGGTGGITGNAALDSLSAAAGATIGTLQRSGSGLWSVAAPAPFTNQTITISGDATGTGTTAIPITLSNTAVAPGSYTNTSLTVDQKGRITAASSGVGGGPYLPLTGGSLTGQLTVNPNIVIGNPVISPPATSLVINKAASTPQASTTPLIWAASEAGGNGVLIDIYSPSASANLTARKARGTAAAPTAVQAADTLSNIITTGYGASAYGNATTLAVKASENWSNTAQGSFFAFSTNTPGTTTIVQRATINQGVVIGNPAGDPGQGGLVLNANAAAPQSTTGLGRAILLQLSGADAAQPDLLIDGYGGPAGVPSLTFRRARGTAAAPTPVQSGENLALIEVYGRGASDYGWNGGAAIRFSAAETFSDTAQGTIITLSTTALGTTSMPERLRIAASGNVGIGTTAPDFRMQVAADINVGTNWPTDPGWAQLAVGGATTPAKRLALAFDTTNNLGIIQSGQFGIGSFPLILQPKGGNVGIGTTAPGTNQLSVVNATPGWFAAKFTSPNTTPSAGVLINAGTGVAGDYALLIQNAPATVNLMWVLGNGSCANTSGAWTTVSDAQVKQDVAPYRRGLEAILKLSPVEFRYAPNTPMSEGNKPSRKLFGLIADEVKPHVPEIVGTTTATIGKKEGVELSTLEPGNLIYALINAVKEMNAEVKDLAAKVAALEGGAR